MHDDPPDPRGAATLDDLAQRLRSLKVWAGDPSYERITRRINAEWTEAGRPESELAGKTTVVDCFRRGRRRLNADLLLAIVRALHADPEYVARWRLAVRVAAGEAGAAAQVRVRDALPQELPGFTGRDPELRTLRAAATGPGAVTLTIEGMAGVGKTQLAAYAARLIATDRPFDRVLVVDLRGFDPAPDRPPVDPSAALGTFLQELGVPAGRIPQDPAARATAWREQLAGGRSLIVLDNAAGAGQARPLLPEADGSVTIVTSRRSLAELPATGRVELDPLRTEDAKDFLRLAAAGLPDGADPVQLARIAQRCGRLPLALGLVAAHIRGRPDWTLADHADRLDELHGQRHLDTGVDLAFQLSYRRLDAAQQRLLRLLSLHPEEEFDDYAAAALADTGLDDAGALLRRLHDDHLLIEAAPSRYRLHDLVRTYAAGRARDEDRPAGRRAAQDRLYFYYVSTAAAAMDVVFPAMAHRRPRIPAAATPVPDLADSEAATRWLDLERPALVAVAARAPAYAVRLSGTLGRYFDGGHHADGMIVHTHAIHAARAAGDLVGEAHALAALGYAYVRVSRYEPGTEHLRQALDLFERAGDEAGQARVLNNLGIVEARQGRMAAGDEHYRRTLEIYRRIGDRIGEAHVNNNLGISAKFDGRLRDAAAHHERASEVADEIGDRGSRATALVNLGSLEVMLGRHEAAAQHLGEALTLFTELGDHGTATNVLYTLADLKRARGETAEAHRRFQEVQAAYRALGDRYGEAWTLTCLGETSADLAERTARHEEALAIFREIGDRYGEARALNGRAEADLLAGHALDAATHHETAREVAAAIGNLDQQARAHEGLGGARQALGDPDAARRQWERSAALYDRLGMPDAARVRDHLTARAAPGR